ncbi:MAG TPA: 4Fe-4S binding protein [Thermotogota bacterium]|nr:4Fe-4S binding protein [Thermotogota bacterium]
MTQRIRLFVQLFFLLFVLYLSVGHYLEENAIVDLPLVASLHSVCPFGGVVTLYTFFSTGDYVQKLHQSTFQMLIALLVLLILTGASFCGWICPLGTVQEWVGKLGRKLLGKRYNRVPYLVDRILSLARYVVLGIVLVQTARTVQLMFQPFDPYYNLFNIWSDEITWTGIAVVVLTLGLSLIVERPFCRYACPLGALNGLFNRISIFGIKRKKSTCISCNLCDKKCPMNIPVANKPMVSSTLCNRCMKCVDSCPVNQPEKKTLTLRPVFKNPEKSGWALNKGWYALLVIVAFAVPLMISVVSGAFVTERVKTYETTTDIRGSSTLQEVLENYGINRGPMYHILGLPATLSAETKLKDIPLQLGILEEVEVFSPESLRLVIDSYALPVSQLESHLHIDVNEWKDSLAQQGIPMEESLENALKKLDAGVYTYWISGIHLELGQATETVVQEEHQGTSTPLVVGGVLDIRGKTTLAELKAAFPGYEEMVAQFQIPADTPLTASLKDLSDNMGIEVSEIRTFVEGYQAP